MGAETAVARDWKMMGVDMTNMRILLLALSLGFAGGFSFVVMNAGNTPPAMAAAAAIRSLAVLSETFC